MALVLPTEALGVPTGVTQPGPVARVFGDGLPTASSALFLPWPPVNPAAACSPTVTGSVLPCSILGTVTRALSSSPADRAALTAHLPYPCLLFPLSWPAACAGAVSFGIKHSLPPAFAVLKQATLSFLMYFQLGCAMRIAICGSVRQLGCCVSWLCQARLGLAVWS